MTSTATDNNAETLQAWLTARVAYYVECDVQAVEPSRSLADYGLDSVLALSLCGDVEDHLDIRLEPTVVWDHPSVAALVAHLTSAGLVDRSTP